MELFAAIDLLGGHARRLLRGDYGRPLAASADPLVLARAWLAAGVSRLHLVDLDGARDGRPANRGAVAAICELAREAAPGTRVQVGGGLRSEESVARLLQDGAHDVLLGSAAIVDPGFLARCAARWPGRVGAALDLRDGRPAIEGWTRAVAQDPFELAGQLLDAGASRLLVTDIAVDGTAAGPSLELLAAFRARFPAAVLLAAGGVGDVADLLALERLGMDGAVVGRALLDGSLGLPEALAACRGEVYA